MSDERERPDTPEFPVGVDLPPTEMARRTFLQLVGASAALAATGCSQPPAHEMLPYHVQPEGLVEGNPLHYATTLTGVDGYGVGVLVTTREGRPLKVEGNPDHPDSLGATHAWEQAAVWSLYDPDRARGVARMRGPLRIPSTWEALAMALSAPRPDGGARLRILMRPTTSPLVGDLLVRALRRHPSARVTFYAPLATTRARAGAQLAFGAPLQPRYDFGRADVIVALDGDFLTRGPGRIRHQAGFAARRRPDLAPPTGSASPMARLYVVEPSLTVAGGMADHRLARPSHQVPSIAAELVDALLSSSNGARSANAEALAACARALRAGAPPEPSSASDERRRAFVAAAARDLAAAGGRVIVYTDERQPPLLHALCHALHAHLGAVGQTVTLGPSPLVEDAPPIAGSVLDIKSLADQLRGGAVDTLLVLGGNPAYDAPADVAFAEAMTHAKTRVVLSPYSDETALAATHHVAEAHPFEAWGDARAVDGTVSLQQPLLRPLDEGHSAAELLAVLAGDPAPRIDELLRARWAGRARGGFPAALQRGLLEGTAEPPATPTVRWSALAAPEPPPAPHEPARKGQVLVEVTLAPDASVLDGTLANNAWLQELPRPFTKLTWDNAALIGPTTAAALGVSTEDLIAVTDPAGRTVEIPALIAPGQADGTVTIALGYGRAHAPGIGERTARGVGRNAYPLFTTTGGFVVKHAIARRVGARHALARTQGHFSLEGRPVALSTTLAAFTARPVVAPHLRGPLPSLMPDVAARELGGRRDNEWAMAIDLSTCVSCNACVVACQAENNTLVVGKEGVLESREMHWLRIDTYYRAPIRTRDEVDRAVDEPRPIHQPMLCQHCEKAPCEYVCPVNATVHSPDGLNEMIYNRCVGTRFCSNNCPYKVRRFNWFRWDERVPVNSGRVSLQKNPDVTVRERGVMEKCTYCVQRIRRAEITARLANRPLADLEVRTACQQACPSGAITFGSLTHKGSQVSRAHESPRSFSVLHELGTRPRTQYLARIEDPSPALPIPSSEKGHHE
jgi:molybdopterin-containing oxidoreductase family iron-sulfur binding subunit